MSGVYHAAVQRMLEGSQDVTKRMIDRVLSATGMTYEEAFARETDKEEEA